MNLFSKWTFEQDPLNILNLLNILNKARGPCFIVKWCSIIGTKLVDFRKIYIFLFRKILNDKTRKVEMVPPPQG